MNEMAHKKLTRSLSDKWLGGVCGGIAEYTGWDANLIRIVVIVLIIAGFGTAILAYIVAWILMPLPTAPTLYDNPEAAPPAEQVPDSETDTTQD